MLHRIQLICSSSPETVPSPAFEMQIISQPGAAIYNLYWILPSLRAINMVKTRIAASKTVTLMLVWPPQKAGLAEIEARDLPKQMAATRGSGKSGL